MARNVGESMGTGAVFKLVDDYRRPIPAGERYRTSISFDNLARIESTLQTLTPPRWPEDLLGPIDQARAARGKELYAQHCVGCHGPHIAADALRQRLAPLRLATDPLWIVRWKDVKDIGTDPADGDELRQQHLRLVGNRPAARRRESAAQEGARRTENADGRSASGASEGTGAAQGGRRPTPRRLPRSKRRSAEAQYPLTDAADRSAARRARFEESLVRSGTEHLSG